NDDLPRVRTHKLVDSMRADESGAPDQDQLAAVNSHIRLSPRGFRISAESRAGYRLNDRTDDPVLKLDGKVGVHGQAEDAPRQFFRIRKRTMDAMFIGRLLAERRGIVNRSRDPGPVETALHLHAILHENRILRSEEHTSELQSQSNIVCR